MTKESIKREIEHLANAIYDHFKDAKMYYEYAISAKEEGNAELANWYIHSAKTRLDMIKPSHEPVKRLLIDGEKSSYYEAVHNCIANEVEVLKKKVMEFKSI